MAKDTERTQAEQDAERDLNERNPEELTRGGANSDVQGIASDEEDEFEETEDLEEEDDDEASM